MVNQPPILGAKPATDPLVASVATGKKAKFVYVGPDYTRFILVDGHPYQPKTLTDEQIETFIATHKWASAWFKEA